MMPENMGTFTVCLVLTDSGSFKEFCDAVRDVTGFERSNKQILRL